MFFVGLYKGRLLAKKGAVSTFITKIIVKFEIQGQKIESYFLINNPASQYYSGLQSHQTPKAHVDREMIQPYHSPPLYSTALVKWVGGNRIRGGYMKEEFIFCYENIVLGNNVKM